MIKTNHKSTRTLWNTFVYHVGSTHPCFAEVKLTYLMFGAFV